MWADKIKGFFKANKSKLIHFIVLIFLGVLSLYLLLTPEYRSPQNPLPYFAGVYLFFILLIPILIGYIPGMILGGLFRQFSFFHYLASLTPMVLLLILELWYVSGVFVGLKAKDPNAKKQLCICLIVIGLITIVSFVLWQLTVF